MGAEEVAAGEGGGGIDAGGEVAGGGDEGRVGLPAAAPLEGHHPLPGDEEGAAPVEFTLVRTCEACDGMQRLVAHGEGRLGDLNLWHEVHGGQAAEEGGGMDDAGDRSGVGVGELLVGEDEAGGGGGGGGGDARGDLEELEAEGAKVVRVAPLGATPA